MHVPRPGERTGGSVGLLPTKNLRCPPKHLCAGVTGTTAHASATPAVPARNVVVLRARLVEGGVMLTPPRHEILAVRGARGTRRAAASGPCLNERRTSPSPPLMGPDYGGRKRALSALLRRPVRLLRRGRSVVTSLSLSAASFCDITCSQKETTASQDPPLPTILRTMAGSDRSPPTSATRVRRGPSHATHSSSTCRAVSSWKRLPSYLYLPQQRTKDGRCVFEIYNYLYQRYKSI